MTFENFHDLALNRYSVRKFKDTPVGKDAIDKILEVARWAPTAKNRQPQRVKVLSSPEDLAKVDEFTPCRFGAPLVFLVCYDSKDSKIWERLGGQHSGETDATIVTTHMMLQACDLGLGSLYIKYFDPQKATELLGLHQDIKPSALLAVGYASEDSEPHKLHFDKKPLKDILI